MENAFVQSQIACILGDGCFVHEVRTAKSGDTVILYSPHGRCDIHARIVYPNGVATKRHRNDLSLHVAPIAGTQVKAWNLQYIRILGDKVNQGFGSIMMRQLLLLAEREGIAYIEGRMRQAEHREHLERLRHFYAKFGFAVDERFNLRWDNEKLRAAPPPCAFERKRFFRFSPFRKAEKKDLHPF
ncbi:hypothetical protein [Paenibacillus glycinis]|uniref:N-acetyltransferase domain-containing protein n=1 Tax=Paenibacillus glycinis TaxID=2697035 RepID=A0ABW9XUP9_9BACL|nr:hypothetical protein [Paenibacillus glycinis]NBD26320.1 hypothetical protein [Paenibacillus glycinis]